MAENPGIDARPFPPQRNDLALTNLVPPPHLPITPPEIIRLSESVNSSAPVDMTQQSKIAAALTKAGIVNAAAWTAAGVPYRGVTVADPPLVSRVYVNGNDKDKDREQPVRPNQQPAFDLTPPVLLMKGENDPAFLISWRSQHDLVRSLGWKSAAMTWGGAALTLLGIYFLLAHWRLL